MRFSIITFLLFFFNFNLCWSQNQNLRAYIDNKQFYSPAIGNFIEIYFQFNATTISYKGRDNGLQGELAIKISIQKEDSIFISDAYRLETPFMKDSIVEDFYDIQRYGLEAGNYLMTIVINDLNANKENVSATIPIQIEEFKNNIFFSDIESIEYAYKSNENSTFSKSGYHIIPRLTSYYPSQLKSIPLYFELYNSNLLKDSIFGIKQTIINTENRIELLDYTSYSKHHKSEVLPLLRNIDISNLPSGNYELKYTVLSYDSKELATQTYSFERSNDIDIQGNIDQTIIDPSFQASITEDSVMFFLESLIPIAKPAEVKNIIASLKEKNSDKQRKHIQLFWLKSSPGRTTDAWLKYKAQVILVDKLYSNNFQEGYETDRGRVYLQYGAPTSLIIQESSPSEYPYEIWQYNKIGSFSNKRFIFYNPDLTNNAYRLLHSDMIGELKNPSWPQALVKRNTNNGNVDDPNSNVQEHYGGKSNDLFRQY